MMTNKAIQVVAAILLAAAVGAHAHEKPSAPKLPPKGKLQLFERMIDGYRQAFGTPDLPVIALDHGGRIPDHPIEIPFEKTKDGVRFTLDGKKSKTMYYLVESE